MIKIGQLHVYLILIFFIKKQLQNKLEQKLYCLLQPVCRLSFKSSYIVDNNIKKFSNVPGGGGIWTPEWTLVWGIWTVFWPG